MSKGFSSSKYVAALQSDSTGPEDWTVLDTIELAPVLRTAQMQKALSILLSEASDMLDRFRALELMDPKGVGEAIRLQGVVEGIERAVQRLVELADHEED